MEMSGVLLESVCEAAHLWRDPSHPARERATRQTLEAPNRFTPEAIIFAANQQFQSLTRESINGWIQNRHSPTRHNVGVVIPGNIPLAGLQDFVAVVLTGHRFLGKLSSRSPVLLPAFADEIRKRHPTLEVDFVSVDEMFAAASALIFTGTDESVAHLTKRSGDLNISPANILTRGHRYSAAIIGSGESSSDLESLAEDVLLHEGLGCRSPAIIWAPAGESPDAFLEALAHFRAVFPAHRDTSASLKMHIAYHSALGTPSGYADDASFLVTKGAPDPQVPAHIRWSEYSDLKKVEEWMDARQSQLQLVVASPRIKRQIAGTSVPVLALGEAQRPTLGWPQDGKDVVSFLCGLE